MRASARLVLFLSLLPALAAAEPLPGLLSREQVRAAKAEAAEQKRDAQAAVRRSARALGYDDAQIDAALTPTMVRSGTFVQELDDGTAIEFPWYRTGFAENRMANTGRRIARDGRGGALREETNKGGVRLHLGVDSDEVYALALKMDTKLALAGDAMAGHAVRGAKGGIGAGRVIRVGRRYQARVGDAIDPASPALDRQAIMRAFAASYRAGGGEVGPGLDIQAGDVNTKAPEMATLAAAHGRGGRPSAGVSGKAVIARPDGSIDPDGGIAYRAESTGEGVWMSARLAARRAGVALRGATVISQGWGEVGRAFGRAAARDGARVIAVQNLWRVDGRPVAGVLLNPAGEHPTPAQTRAFLAAVDALIASGEDVGRFEGGRLAGALRVGLDASAVRADIVGSNALGGALDGETVPAFVRSGTHQGKRKVIVEGANLAETDDGAAAIDRRTDALLVVPGDLANMGGVHVSNLEAIQNHYQQVIGSDQARRSVRRTLGLGWDRAMKLAAQHGLSERAAIELAATDAMMRRSLDLPDAPRASLERRVLTGAALERALASRRRLAPRRPRPRIASPSSALTTPAEALALGRLSPSRPRPPRPRAGHPLAAASDVRTTAAPRTRARTSAGGRRAPSAPAHRAGAR